MRRHVFPLVAVFVLLPFLATPAGPGASAQPADGRGNPRVEFDGAFDAADPTPPLGTSIKGKLKDRRDKERREEKIHPRCAAALDAVPPDEADIEKFCAKSPGHRREVLKNEPILAADGRKLGKRVKTRTTLTFANPGQRYGHEKRVAWDRLVLRPPKTGDLTARSYRNQTNTADKGRNRQFLGDDAGSANDDKDCVDSLTGAHLGGAGVPDGEPGSCFDQNGSLRRTLTAVATGGCVHTNGTFLPGEPADGAEDDCYDAVGTLKTTLTELVDEDGPSADARAAGDGVYDVDGDGEDGEDGPNGLNDDRDCVDMVSGKRLRDAGCFAGAALKMTLEPAYAGCTDASGAAHDGDPYDGLDDVCFDGAGSVKPGMTATERGCRHLESGTFFEGERADGIDDACYDRDGSLKTTLAELIDEDDGRPVDDDHDGVADEDGPATPADFGEMCRAKAREISGRPDFDVTGVVTADGGCDLTRAVIVKVNREAMAGTGAKGFKADDQGYPDANVDGNAVDYGAEQRRLEIEEDFTVLCEEGKLLDEETGQCVAEGQVAALADYRAAGRAVAAAAPGSAQDYALMGFTFAPPRLRWGLFYKEELDLWLFTITLFEAKIGFDFGLGVGFRLPVLVEVANLPEVSAPAESELELLSSVMPLNFSAQDYRGLCLGRGMGDGPACERFAFTDAIVPEDGDELALRLTAFAGIKVVILSIPIIDWGVDVDLDLPEMGSLYLAWDNIEDVAQEMLLGGVGFGQALANLNLNCGSYTTPYGNDEEGNPRQFPFIQNAPFVNQMVRADCAEAFLRDETVKLPSGEIFPICTGLILGVPGLSLGLGLGMDLEINSNLIEAEATVQGDGRFAGLGAGAVQELDYHAAASGGSEPTPIDTIRLDNYDNRDTEDHARLVLNDFTYCLNTFSIRLKGQAMFGGLLTIFPDFPDFTIYRLTVPFLSDACVIPIGQHAGTGAVEVPVLVENYGLEVKVATDPEDPNRVDNRTLRFPYDKNAPGGDFLVSVKNVGSFPGGFDQFDFALSNLRDQTEPYTFVIDPDNDADGLVDEDDFGPAGALREERDADHDGMADEDPPDLWQTAPPRMAFNVQTLEAVPAHTDSSGAGISPLTLKVTPFVHPSTAPGLYPFRVTADSRDARELGLSTVDPSLNRRTGAGATAFILVESFFDPRVAVQPAAASAAPGVPVAYTVEGSNMGNSEDVMAVAVAFPDFNESGCDITDRGSLPGCPFRAEPTAIQADAWTTVASLPALFGPLAPLAVATGSFSITVPPTWEGMADTTYRFQVTVKSLEDDDPPASSAVTVEHTVTATRQSMIRYIRHEILELIGEIEQANAQGIRTGGLLPIALHPAWQKIEQALELVLAGNPSGATNALASNVKVVGAFVRALDGYNGRGTKIPAALDGDWHRRATAIIADLETAAAGGVGSAAVRSGD